MVQRNKDAEKKEYNEAHPPLPVEGRPRVAEKWRANVDPPWTYDPRDPSFAPTPPHTHRGPLALALERSRRLVHSAGRSFSFLRAAGLLRRLYSTAHASASVVAQRSWRVARGTVARPVISTLVEARSSGARSLRPGFFAIYAKELVESKLKQKGQSLCSWTL